MSDDACPHGAVDGCVPCARLRAAVRIDERLDDVRRARMWGRLERAIAAPAERAAASRARFLGAGVLAAAAGMALAAWLWWPREPRDAGGARFEAPAGARLDTAIDERVHVTLIGPASMRVVEDRPALVEVRLDRGTMVGDFEGGAGHGRLLIRSPGAVTEIVGTLFAIEVRGDDSCVSVSHGVVKVTAHGAVRRIAGGQGWCTDEAVVREAGVDEEAEMEAHQTARGNTAAAAAAAPAAAPAPVAAAAAAPAAAPAAEPPPPPKPAKSAVAPTVATPDAVAIAAPEPPPPPSPPPAADPPATAESLYERAERAMSAGKHALADALLEKLITDHADDPLADEARLERAHLAADRGDPAAARAHLAPLVRDTANALSASAHYLSCRLAITGNDADADDCLRDFLVAHPDSSRRREILEWGVRRAYDTGGCAGAASWLTELIAAAPRWKSTLAWQRACPEAGQ